MEKLFDQIEQIYEDFDCGSIGGDSAMELIGDILNLRSQFDEIETGDENG